MEWDIENMTDHIEHHMVVEVLMLTDEEMLHENDVDSDGNCKVDGKYFMKLVACDEADVDPMVKACEIVEKSGHIDCVTDFDFRARPATRDEIDNARISGSHFRDNLGSYTMPLYTPRPGM